MKPLLKSSDPLGDILGALLGGGAAQPDPASPQSPGQVGGQVLGTLSDSGFEPQAASSAGGGDLGSLLGGLLGGGAQQGAAGGGDIGSLLGGLLGGGAQQGAAGGGGDIGSLLGGLLGGGAAMGTTSQAGSEGGGLGGMLGGMLGTGAITLALNATPIGPMIDDLAGKLGIPPAIAKTVVAFAATKLIAAAMQNRGDQKAGGANDTTTDALAARLSEGQPIDRKFITQSGLADELAQQTGLDKKTATKSLQQSFGALQEQLPSLSS
jgi:hypothetical protein